MSLLILLPFILLCPLIFLLSIETSIYGTQEDYIKELDYLIENEEDEWERDFLLSERKRLSREWGL